MNNQQITTAINRRVYAAFNAGHITKSGFSETVATHAPRSAGLAPLSINMPETEYYVNAEANHKKIWRKIDRKTQEFHIDLLGSIIKALPEPYKSYLTNDVSSIINPVQISDDDVTDMDVIKESSEAITALSTQDVDNQIKELIEAKEVIVKKLATLTAQPTNKEDKKS